ncbi:MAG: DUF4340 domain-containing protein [Polyangiaceae bacterium]|nr:DUF4340 domain-containing protein [Polyangiaceae bacterium]
MKKLSKHITSIILVTTALGLGTYVWLDKDKPTSQEIEARKSRLFPLFRNNEITHIEIDSNEQKIKLHRKKNPDTNDYLYYLVEPNTIESTDVVADQVAVDRLINTLERTSYIRKLDNDVDETTIGFDAPAIVISVQMGSTKYRVSFGSESKTPVGSRYLKLDGFGLYVIDGSNADTLMRPIDAYRPRRILPYAASELESLELENRGGSVRIDRGPWGGFRVDNALGKPRVSQASFDRLLHGFAEMNAEIFLDKATAENAIDQSSEVATLKLVPKAGETSELRIGGPCPDELGSVDGVRTTRPKLAVAVRVSPTPLYACVPYSVLDDLNIAPDSLVDRRILRTTLDEVEEFRIVSGDAVLELARKGSGWHVRSPEDRDIPAEDVSGYLSALIGIEGIVQTNADLAGLGLSPPRGTIIIRQPSLEAIEVPPQVVEIGSEIETPDCKAIAVRRVEDSIVMHIPISAAPLLEASLTRIRSTELLSVNSLRVKRIETSFVGGYRQVLERNGPGFSMEEPEGYGVDTAIAADLFQSVGSIRAERWIADADDGSYGFGAPYGSVRVMFDGDKGEEQRELLIGDETIDGRFGRWGTDNGIFVLSRSFDSAVRTYAIDRFVFMVESSEVGAVIMRAGNVDIRVAATGEEWRSIGGSLHPMSAGTVSRLRQALSEIRAEGVVHVGAAKPEEGLNKPLLRYEIDRRSGTRSGKMVVEIGYGDVWRSSKVYYARIDGVDATFAIVQSRVRPLFDVMGIP